MRNLTLAASFTLFSVIMPLSLAQHAVAHDQIKVQSVRAVASDENLLKFSDDASETHIVIKFDDKSLVEIDRKINSAIERFAEVFGETLVIENSTELVEFSAEEKAKFEAQLQRLFEDNSISFSDN